MQKSAVIFKVLTGEVEIEGAYGIHFVFFNFFLGRNFAYNNGILQNETPDPAIHFFLFCQNLYFREPSIKSGRSIRWRDDDENTHDPIYEKIYFIKDTVSGLFKKPGENKNQAGGSGNHLAAPEQENLIPWKLPEVSNGKAPKIVKINKNLDVMETSEESKGPPIIIQHPTPLPLDSTPHKTGSTPQKPWPTPQKTVNIPMTSLNSLNTGPTPHKTVNIPITIQKTGPPTLQKTVNIQGLPLPQVPSSSGNPLGNPQKGPSTSQLSQNIPSSAGGMSKKLGVQVLPAASPLSQNQDGAQNQRVQGRRFQGYTQVNKDKSTPKISITSDL